MNEYISKQRMNEEYMTWSMGKAKFSTITSSINEIKVNHKTFYLACDIQPSEVTTANEYQGFVQSVKKAIKKQ